ncbi:hypothetical protein K7432_010297 [Basidiobolus ranarum]|uniref:Uncharacterized protein n=1 Tax=Basidiobolus ranarum TaxID=34480 RepID=A0ABR2WP13_9FUNG
MSATESWKYPEHKTYTKVTEIEEVDKNDREAVLAARNQRVREDWVKLMEERIVKKKLRECYKTQGVNHYENCRHLALSYLKSLRTNKVRGPREINDTLADF